MEPFGKAASSPQHVSIIFSPGTVNTSQFDSVFFYLPRSSAYWVREGGGLTSFKSDCGNRIPGRRGIWTLWRRRYPWTSTEAVSDTGCYPTVRTNDRCKYGDMGWPKWPYESTKLDRQVQVASHSCYYHHDRECVRQTAFLSFRFGSHCAFSVPLLHLHRHLLRTRFLYGSILRKRYHTSPRQPSFSDTCLEWVICLFSFRGIIPDEFSALVLGSREWIGWSQACLCRSHDGLHLVYPRTSPCTQYRNVTCNPIFFWFFRCCSPDKLWR